MQTVFLNDSDNAKELYGPVLVEWKVYLISHRLLQREFILSVCFFHCMLLPL